MRDRLLAYPGLPQNPAFAGSQVQASLDTATLSLCDSGLSLHLGLLPSLEQEAEESTGSQQPGVKTATAYLPEIQAHGLVQLLPALLCKQRLLQL